MLRLTREIVTRARTPARTCPYCRADVATSDPACACGVVYHRECRAALDRCATLGCAATPEPVTACRACRAPVGPGAALCFACAVRGASREQGAPRPPADHRTFPPVLRWALIAAAAVGFVVLFLNLPSPWNWAALRLPAIALGVLLGELLRRWVGELFFPSR